jgi:glycosyltransferase involved in cell wall biosynthesis
MVSFQHRLSAGLRARGAQVTYDPGEPGLTAILVVGGTRRLPALWSARQRGVPIIQRLDGMNWLHRIQRTGIRHYLRAEYGNLVLRIIRSHIASGIVYQSEFSRQWWERRAGITPVPHTVIYNGVDLEIFHPRGAQDRPDDRYRILLVEGSMMGGYEAGLEVAAALASGIAERIGQPGSQLADRPVELMVVGRVAVEAQRRWTQWFQETGRRLPVTIHWAGLVPGQEIPGIDRSAHVYYSADINAACPNSVIEALACGLPVVAFATGALPELVAAGSGQVVAYGADPWKLEAPDVPALVRAAEEVLIDQMIYRQAARARAEILFGLDRMVQEYLDQLLENG